MTKTIKLKPDSDIYYKRRKVLYYVCEESDEDTTKRVKRLKELAENNKVPIRRISAAGTIKYYESVTEAAKASGASYSSVSKCINGKQNSAAGYSFYRDLE